MCILNRIHKVCIIRVIEYRPELSPRILQIVYNHTCQLQSYPFLYYLFYIISIYIILTTPLCTT